MFYHPAFSERWKEERINEEFKSHGKLLPVAFFESKSYVSYKAFKQYEKGDYMNHYKKRVNIVIEKVDEELKELDGRVGSVKSEIVSIRKTLGRCKSKYR